MTKLLACPFCGGEAYIELGSDIHFPKNTTFQATCQDCRVKIEPSSARSHFHDMAIRGQTEIWNTRSTTSSTRGTE